MSPSIQYQYADGSGNRYEITPTTLEYFPVTPEKSSSGIYSGGVPGKVLLAEDQFEAVVILLENAIEKKDIHVPDREMMTGLIIKNSPTESKTIVIRSGSAEMKQIENLLHTLLPTGKHDLAK